MATITIERTVTYRETYVVEDVATVGEAIDVINEGGLDPDEAEQVGDEQDRVIRIEDDDAA